jgi:hypothetical protein
MPRSIADECPVVEWNSLEISVYVLCYDGTISATDVGAGGIGNWYGDNTAYQMKVHASATTANLDTPR